MAVDQTVNFASHPIDDGDYRERCRLTLDDSGSLLLHEFLMPEAVDTLRAEALEHAGLAYYCEQTHSAYLDGIKPEFTADHPANRQLTSSKGCITDDQVPEGSLLRDLYGSDVFQEFLCAVLGEAALYQYADPLSSINVHYYQEGQELGWHFDNSSFAVTLMLDPPEDGGQFQYIPALRDHGRGDMNYAAVGEALDGKVQTIALDIRAGTLALFRGRNALHRVSPVVGDKPRIQVVLAYNGEPGVSLSEKARLTFYGRTG